MTIASRWPLFAIALLLFAGGLRADPRADALAIVQAGITAHGGKDALQKATTFQRSGKGELFLPTAKSNFSDTVVARLPEQVRITVELERGGKVTTVVNGKTGWKALPSGTVDLPAETVNELREEAYIQWLTTLVPLLADGFTLTPAGDAERNDRKVAGVNVASKGHDNATLWFDRETRLLIAIDKEVKEAGQTLRKRYLFSDHKEFGGVKLPTKLSERINDRLVTEVIVKEMRLLDRVDETGFIKP